MEVFPKLQPPTRAISGDLVSSGTLSVIGLARSIMYPAVSNLQGMSEAPHGSTWTTLENMSRAELGDMS